MLHYERAFITGASSGIGRALSLELARRGARVVLAARRLERLEDLVAEIRAAGGRADACELDVEEPEAIQAAITKWDAELGGLDLIIANAGVGHAAPATELAWTEVAQVVNVNVAGAFATLLAGRDVMLPRGSGTLVGVSSLAGLRALPGTGAYAASKAALQSFLETLELDLCESGLRIVDIQPGFVRSEMTDRNDFDMPFLWEVDKCARVCVDRLEEGRSVIHFPWQLSWSLRYIGRICPRPLWRFIMRRLRPKG